jgi:hypothetical protein
MSPTLILFPVFALIGLTFALLYWMGTVRVASVKSGEIKIKDIALGQDVWPTKVQQISNCFHNQFELPVLFYVFAAFVMITRQLDIVTLVLAWVFVALRFAHAYVHTGSNDLPTRFNIYAAGMFSLVAMWLWFASRITMASV